MEIDILDYPDLYLYERGEVLENPVKYDGFKFYEC